jgi:hypothetical protein
MKWTPELVADLRQLYPDMTAAEIAVRLGLPIKSVQYKAHKLGLKKSEAFKASEKSGRIQRGKQHPSMIASQFKPGQQPWNAGRKGWQAGGRSAETRFTTGMVPPNTQPVGSYRIITSKQGHPHLEQKVCETPGPNHLRWVPVSRLVWEAAHGALPAGHIVVFKPGMRTTVAEEITLDRLELITRAENAQRNHPKNKSPELAKLYQLKGAITRQVNRLKKESEQNHD